MKKIGIYIISNNINKKKYIGSSQNISNRFSKHKSDLKKNKHHSYLLQKSWNKYGESNFNFEILETLKTSDNLKKIELEYLKKYNPEFNIEKIPNNGFLGKNHSDNTKKLISEKKKGTNKGTLNPMYKKIGIQHHNFGKKMPQNGRNGIQHHNYGKPSYNRKKVIQFDLNGDFISEYPSLKMACEVLSIHKTYISGCCNGRYKNAKGFIFKYKNP